MSLSETVRNGTNINTWVTLAGFLLVIAGGIATYGQERAENRLRHAEGERRHAALEGTLQRYSAEREAILSLHEGRIRALETSAARGDAQMAEIYRMVADLRESNREILALVRQFQSNMQGR